MIQPSQKTPGFEDVDEGLSSNQKVSYLSVVSELWNQEGTQFDPVKGQRGHTSLTSGQTSTVPKKKSSIGGDILTMRDWWATPELKQSSESRES